MLAIFRSFVHFLNILVFLSAFLATKGIFKHIFLQMQIVGTSAWLDND